MRRWTSTSKLGDDTVKKFGESAIHDHGFQFFMILKIEQQLEGLIDEIKALHDCMATHKEWKLESWYSSKTKVHCDKHIDGYAEYHPSFTILECKKVLEDRQIKYDLLILLSESALEAAIKRINRSDNLQHHEPYYKDIERRFVIVDDDS